MKWYEQWMFLGYVLGYWGEKKFPRVNLLPKIPEDGRMEEERDVFFEEDRLGPDKDEETETWDEDEDEMKLVWDDEERLSNL